MRQIPLFSERVAAAFGGAKLKGQRKSRRPLSTQRPLHLVLKARQDFLLLRNRRAVEVACRKFASRFGLRIYGFAVQADHVHMALKIPERALYTRWIRAVTAKLVRLVSGLKWRHRPFTRVVAWGRDLRSLRMYIFKNAGEADVVLRAHQALGEFKISLRGPASASHSKDC